MIFFKKKHITPPAVHHDDTQTITFGFGDPVKVLGTVDLLNNYLNSYFNGTYFEMQISPSHLYKSQFSNPHHLSAMQLKVNLLCDLFVPSAKLDLPNFRNFCQNALTFGNAYLQEIPSLAGGRSYQFKSVPSMYVRYMGDDQYGILPSQLDIYAKSYAGYRITPLEGKVWHWKEHDLEQEIYGKPYYLAALQAAWLNEDATLFRRNYFKNGNHAGFVLYMNDPAHNMADVEALKQAFKDAKGPGAFRNMFFYAPKGKKDGIQVIPVESAQAQDKFFEIKNVSRDDIMAAHRVYPNLLAVPATNAGGFGNILESRQAFVMNEIVPLAKMLSTTHPVLTFKLPV